MLNSTLSHCNITYIGYIEIQGKGVSSHSKIVIFTVRNCQFCMQKYLFAFLIRLVMLISVPLGKLS